MGKKQIGEVLAESLESVLFQLGRGIAQVQMELDRNSLATQIMIDSSPELRKTGIEATWYQIPEVDFELKVSVHVVEKTEGNIKKKKLYISPFNASYKNSFNYEATGSSTLKMKIVPVPPPYRLKGGED
ncbi:hypothetical protein [Persephonella sp.]